MDPALSRPGHDLGEDLPVDGVVGVHDVGEPGPDQLLTRAPEEFQQRVVDELHPALEVEHGSRDAALFEKEVPELRLSRTFLLHPLLFPEV